MDRLTFAAVGDDGFPLVRDQFAADLALRAGDGTGPEWLYATEDEAVVLTYLLDELAALLPDEPLGNLAHDMSRRLCRKLGYVEEDGG